MKQILLAACAVLAMAGAAQAKDLVLFPSWYQGEWCGVGEADSTYMQRTCGEPGGQKFIAADTYVERDMICRMISAVGLMGAMTRDAPFNARVRCIGGKGGGHIQGYFEMTLRFGYNRDTAKLTITLVKAR